MKRALSILLLVGVLVVQTGCDTGFESLIDDWLGDGGGYDTVPFQNNWGSDGCYSNWATDVYVCGGLIGY